MRPGSSFYVGQVKEFPSSGALNKTSILCLLAVIQLRGLTRRASFLYALGEGRTAGRAFAPWPQAQCALATALWEGSVYANSPHRGFSIGFIAFWLSCLLLTQVGTHRKPLRLGKPQQWLRPASLCHKFCGQENGGLQQCFIMWTMICWMQLRSAMGNKCRVGWLVSLSW